MARINQFTATSPTEGSAELEALRPAPAVASEGPAACNNATSGVFTWMFLATFLVLLPVAWIVNLVGNNQGVFPSPLNESQTDIHWKASQLDRLIQEGKPPQVLILGSSRMRQINPAYIQAITGKSAFNYATNGARVLNWSVQLRHMLRAGAVPEVVLVSADEYFLDGDIEAAQCRLAGQWSTLQELPFPDNIQLAAQIVQNFDVRTTLGNVRSIVQRLRKTSLAGERAFDEKESGSYLLEDGYQISYLQMEAVANGRFDLSRSVLKTDLNRWIKAGQEHFQPSPRYYEMFRELLQLAKSLGIRVIVVVPPLHPEALNCLQLKVPGYSEERARFYERIEETCREYGATFQDYSDLASFGGDPNEFWDATHQTPENMRKMTDAIFGVVFSNVAVHAPTDWEMLHRLRHPIETNGK
jgi:hypothetical protein